MPLPTSLADVPLPHHPGGLPLTTLLAHLEELPPAEDLDDGFVNVGLSGIGRQLRDRYPLRFGLMGMWPRDHLDLDDDLPGVVDGADVVLDEVGVSRGGDGLGHLSPFPPADMVRQDRWLSI